MIHWFSLSHRVTSKLFFYSFTTATNQAATSVQIWNFIWRAYGLPSIVCNPRWHWLSHYWDIRPNCDKWAKTDKISFQWPIVYMIHLDLQSRDNDGILGLKWSIIYFEMKASTLPINTSFAPYCYFLSSATAPPKNGK